MAKGIDKAIKSAFGHSLLRDQIFIDVSEKKIFGLLYGSIFNEVDEKVIPAVKRELLQHHNMRDLYRNAINLREYPKNELNSL